MPYKKRHQDKRISYQEKVQEKVEKGDINKVQADKLVAAWDRDQVLYDECGDHPNQILRVDPYRKKIDIVL